MEPKWLRAVCTREFSQTPRHTARSQTSFAIKAAARASLSSAYSRFLRISARRVKSWEFIANRLSKAGWSLGWVSSVDSEGRTIWIVDAYRGDGRRFIVRADDNLSAFVELEREVLTVTFYGDN